MPGKYLLLTLAFLSVPVMIVAQATRDVIPAGTLLQCTLDEPNFTSKTVMVGDPVLCHLAALGAFGHSVFPRGADLGGHLADAKSPGHFVGKGWMEVEFDRMILPGAQILPLSAKVVSATHLKVDAEGKIHGKGHPVRDAVEWTIPIFWPVKIITLPARGPYPALKGETRLSLRVMEDVEVPFTTARSSIPKPPWATPSSYYSSSGEVFRPASTTLQPQPAVQRASYSKGQQAPGEQLTVIALRTGAAFLAQQYWVEGGRMRCVSSGGAEQTFPLEEIDLASTVKINQERNVKFVLQSRDVMEQ